MKLVSWQLWLGGSTTKKMWSKLKWQYKEVTMNKWQGWDKWRGVYADIKEGENEKVQGGWRYMYGWVSLLLLDNFGQFYIDMASCWCDDSGLEWYGWDWVILVSVAPMCSLYPCFWLLSCVPLFFPVWGAWSLQCISLSTRCIQACRQQFWWSTFPVNPLGKLGSHCVLGIGVAQRMSGWEWIGVLGRSSGQFGC